MSSTHRLFLFALASSALGACSSSSQATLTLPPAPSAEILCKLSPRLSTEDDALRALGPPTQRQTFSDGAAYFTYQYAPLSNPAILDLQFSPDHTFVNASLVNLAQPACWVLDGGH